MRIAVHTVLSSIWFDMDEDDNLETWIIIMHILMGPRYSPSCNTRPALHGAHFYYNNHPVYHGPLLLFEPAMENSATKTPYV